MLFRSRPNLYVPLGRVGFLAALFGYGVIASYGAVTPAGVSVSPPDWAYPLNLGGPPKAPPDGGSLRHVPNSTVALTQTQILNRFAAVDWHPEAHPPMPAPVARGRQPDAFACGYCHYPNGLGRPENASLAGLPASYIVEQVGAFRDGSRRSSQPRMIAPALMTKMAMHATNEEITLAAAYYAGLRYRRWVRVVESETVPRVEVHGVSAYASSSDGAPEPIGDRIVEIPEDRARTDRRDDASGFVAYAPPGSIARGKSLAQMDIGTRKPCRTCHGDDLRGTAAAPPLAGRSPSYLFRQLFDIQSGARTGARVEPMKQEVADLTAAEMRDLVAFIAAQAPAN